MSGVDPRLGLLLAHLRTVEEKGGVTEDWATEVLGDLDALSPNETIRRLQGELVAAWNGEAVDWELDRAMQILTDMDICQKVQDELTKTNVFGGMDHPLWAKAEARIVALRDELEELQ